MKLPVDSIKKKVKRTYRQIKKSLSKKKNQRKLLGIAAALLTLSLGSALLLNNSKDNRQKLQLQSQVESRQMDVEIKGAELKEILEEKSKVEQQRIETERKLHETNMQVEDLKKQVRAKRESQARLASARPQPRPTAAVVPPKARAAAGNYKGRFPFGWCTFFASQQRPDLNVSGNAANWIRWSNGRIPRIGAVAVNTSAAGGLGHVAIVVRIDGTRTLVRHMNWRGFGVVSEDWVNASYWVGYIY